MARPPLIARAVRAILFIALPPWARGAALGDLEEEYARVLRDEGRAAATCLYLRAALGLSARYAIEWPRRDPRISGNTGGSRMPLSARVADFSRDVRMALRQVRLRPTFWLTVTLTLGIAVGFNAATFALLKAVLHKPLAREEPDRVVRLYARADQHRPAANFSYRDFRVLADPMKTVTQVAAVAQSTLLVAEGDARIQVLGEIASASYFDLLDIELLAGRAIEAGDDRRDADPVALVSEHHWRHQLAAAPILGRPVTISGRAFIVVGIVAGGFGGSFPSGGVDVWLPLEAALSLLGPDAASNGNVRPLHLVARLGEGASRAQAEAELQTYAPVIARHRGATSIAFEAVPGTVFHGRARTLAAALLAMLTALVLFVLFIATSNVANLMLARAGSRRREIAIRVSLGAGRGRIIQQLMAESMVVASAALAIGFGMAWAIGRVFRSVTIVPGFDLRLDLLPDLKVFAATAGVAGAAAVIATLLPALTAGRGALVTELKEGGGSVGGRRALRVRSALVVVQVTIAVVVCVSTGLLAKSGREAANIDLGFDRDRLFATDIDLDVAGYREDRGQVFFRKLLERASGLPAVEQVALANRAPLDSSTPTLRALREGESESARGAVPAGLEATYHLVSPGYFATVGVPLTAGRVFDVSHVRGKVPVAVVNEFFVAALWPATQPSDAIGKRFRVAARSAPEGGVGGGVEIIGVARNARYRTLGEPPQPHVYLPHAQHYLGSMALLVRSKIPRLPTMDVQRMLSGLDPAVQGFFTRTFHEHTRVAFIPVRFAARVSGWVSMVSALLAALGLYALVAYVVADRRREFGLRMALGASGTRVWMDVIRQAAGLAAAGVLIGLAISAVAGRLLESLLYDVSPTDVPTYAAVGLGAICVAVLAAWLPARRASRVAPVLALRP